MTRGEALQQIEKECSAAQRARNIGNDGMARVCARRAAGVAVSYWLQTNSRSHWGVDAMNQLRSLALDSAIPRKVRDAATRLTTRITNQFTSPFFTDPIEDATIIINHLMEPS